MSVDLVKSERHQLVVMGMSRAPMLQIMGMVWCRMSDHRHSAWCLGGMSAKTLRAVFIGAESGASQ